MALVAKEDAKSLLEAHHPRIRGVIERAWAECRVVSRLKAEAGIGPTLYRRTVSNDVFDAIARHAIIEFGSDPVVGLKVEAQTIKLFFQGRVLARFKRGGTNKLGRNIATQSVMEFIGADRSFSGLPPETAKVEFIWMTNDIQTSLDSVLVVARDGNRLVWEYEIEPADSVVTFPVRESEPEEDEGLVKPRRRAVAKTQEQD